MSNESQQPSRRGLILGAALVALYGLRQEFQLEARHWGYTDFSQHAGFSACNAALLELRAGKPLTTHHERIVDLLAHTQQTLQLSHEEWESVVKFETPPWR